VDQPSPDFRCGRNLEFRKLVPAPEGDNADADRTRGPADGPAAEATPLATSEALQNNTATAPAPVATAGAEAPNVGSKAGKASKNANRMKDAVRFSNLLEMFFTKRLAKPPSRLTIEDLNAPFTRCRVPECLYSVTRFWYRRRSTQEATG
jgi:hypothetical protein